ncbi:ABC transporter ATP-binding protein [[Clostridium] aminophilum]|uniref:ABC transporter ATP-binding protein n=1 Tax=[Clostridium] aminophilum TaxID=1526 RepID=UPI00332CF9D3
MKLEVRDGCFGYAGKLILRDINFEIGEKTIMTVLGPNGVGKTTMLKCIMGFLKWVSGENYLDGRKIASYTDREFWKKTSYVPQAKRSVFSYRCIDMIVMGLSSRQNFFEVPSREDYEKAEHVMEMLGIADLSGKYCNALSGGELQMVMIARAIISDPELVILDEPESNLDMKNQLRVIDTIVKIKEEFGTSCLINTHFPDHALAISDTTLMLGAYNRKLLGKTKEVVTEDNIRQFFSVCSKIVSLRISSEEYQTIFPYKVAR